MDLAQLLICLVILLQMALLIATFYMYVGNRLRLFFYLGLGFLALLMASVLQVALSGSNTELYIGLLEVGAGLFLISGILSTV
ncbi:MAG TPA: hypothetical protein VK436_04565 [Methanocella sp.]|nr:hypothetical protein [Methanocella sp.]